MLRKKNTKHTTTAGGSFPCPVPPWMGWFRLYRVRLSCIVLSVSFLLQQRDREGQQRSPYECGFDPFEDAREAFDVRFALVAVLFLLFDVEVAFLFPFGVSWARRTRPTLRVVFLFFLILTLGLWYEWRRGALDWS